MSLGLVGRATTFALESTAIDRFLRGVVYVIDPALACRLAVASPLILTATTIGSELYEHPAPKRSIDYSVSAFDEVRGCEVRDRLWPHCWGDAMAAIGSVDEEAILLTWTLDAPSHVLLIPSQENRGPRYYHDYLREALEVLCRVEASKNRLLPPEWVKGPPPRDDDR